MPGSGRGPAGCVCKNKPVKGLGERGSGGPALRNPRVQRQRSLPPGNTQLPPPEGALLEPVKASPAKNPSGFGSNTQSRPSLWSLPGGSRCGHHAPATQLDAGGPPTASVAAQHLSLSEARPGISRKQALLRAFDTASC